MFFITTTTLIFLNICCQTNSGTKSIDLYYGNSAVVRPTQLDAKYIPELSVSLASVIFFALFKPDVAWQQI